MLELERAGLRIGLRADDRDLRHLEHVREADLAVEAQRDVGGLRRLDAPADRHAVLELDHDVLDVLVDDLDVLADIGDLALAERRERVGRGPHADDLELPSLSVGSCASATCCDAIENPPTRMPATPFVGSRLSTTLPLIEYA